MNRKNRWTLLTGILLALALTLSSAEMQKENRSFDGVKVLQMSMVSGDCVVKAVKGSKIEVLVSYDYDKDDFTPVFKQDGDTLILKEDFTRGSANGHSRWEISVPADTQIRFRSASGDLELDGCENGVKAKSASGDMLIQDCKGETAFTSASGDIVIKKLNGELSIQSASGDVHVEDAKGNNIGCRTASGEIRLQAIKGALDIACASGDIRAEALSLTDSSSFKAASGDVNVVLTSPLKNDITVISASGNAVLDYNGQEMNGSFEMSARKGSAIIAPFSFDTEEEIEKHGQSYIKKTAKRQSDTPRIVVKSASGRAEIKK